MPSPYRAVNTLHLGYRIQSADALHITLAVCCKNRTNHGTAHD